MFGYMPYAISIGVVNWNGIGAFLGRVCRMKLLNTAYSRNSLPDYRLVMSRLPRKYIDVENHLGNKSNSYPTGCSVDYCI
jgi:hypothetical protein